MKTTTCLVLFKQTQREKKEICMNEGSMYIGKEIKMDV